MTEPVVVGPDIGESVHLYGVRFTFKLTGQQTGGALAIVETEVPPRTLVKPHVHTREDEYTLVLRGRIGLRLGDAYHEVSAGSYLAKPRSVPHAIWNAGSEPAVLAEMIMPAGFEQYFAEIEPILSGRQGDAAAFDELADRYGLTVVNEWIDELEERFGVSLQPEVPSAR